MRKRSLIAFDLDGTLVNTIPSITKALNMTFLKFGFDVINNELVKAKVGLPVESLFQHLSLNPIDVIQLTNSFRSNLKTCISTADDVYPGILEILKKLTSDDCVLSVATSKPTDLAIMTLENTGIYDFFDFVVGADHGKHKPDPWVLLEVESKFGRKIDLFIGDRLEDAAASNSAGVPFVGVLNSVHTRADFQTYPNLTICNDSKELLKFINAFH